MTKTSKHGFTLAEVLTTLMVIGVVAAMTIPTLINSTNDQQNKVAFKKAISVLSQGTQLLIAKEIECTISNDETLTACMAKVISGSIDSTDNTVLRTSDGMLYKFFYGKSSAANYSDLAGACDDTDNSYQNTQANWEGQYSCGVIVDTNGLEKGTKGISSTLWGSDGSATSYAYSFSAGTGFKLAAGKDGSNNTAGNSTDQFPILLNSTSIKPAYGTGFTKGYEYMYGNTTQPYSSTK